MAVGALFAALHGARIGFPILRSVATSDSTMLLSLQRSVAPAQNRLHLGVMPVDRTPGI